ncbi:MAG: amino acid permease [Candidatus Eremiobacteraeota bacterium]|nr:amino acid permease [Candidatus Eremiobacteraeota bacterium]
MSDNSPRMEIHAELSRDLNLVSALAIGVGTMIAAGIFTLSGLAVRNVGSSAIVAFLLAALVATFTALTYCEFSSIYPESGEGYLYARKTFPPPVAYFVGWALFLGYSSSCAFYIASLSSYFNEFVYEFGFESMAGLIGLVLLTMLNLKGTKESGSFQVIITGAKVVLLIWFIGGGLMAMDTSTVVERFSHDSFKILQTAALVFITFFGFSAIAASAGEVQDPTRNIPRAIFISMGLVTVLYTLVIISIVGANLSEYSEAAMGKAAEMFLGPIGGKVIVGGALFSMISAANASIMAGSRVVLAMSQLGHMPEGIGAIWAKTRTPAASILMVSGAIAAFVLALHLEELAHFADAVLLLALITVNYALIAHRKRYPDMERLFRVPGVPVTPILAMLANSYLLLQALSHPRPAVLTVVSLLAGLIAFFVWKSSQAVEMAIPGAPSKVALVEAAVTQGGFRVLVPIANPATVERLVQVAASAAGPGGEVVAVRVISVPEQLPPQSAREYIERERKILEQAFQKGAEMGVAVTSVVRIGHHVARAILETSREHQCQLIVLGWKGYSTTAQRILGETIDSVVSHARADIMLVKLSEKPFGGRILLPTAGGSHARKAENYAAQLATRMGSEHTLTLCSVSSPEAPEESKKIVSDRVDSAVTRVKEQYSDLEVHGHLITHADVTMGILEEARNFDALVVGAAGHSVYPQILFGNIPEALAKHFDGPVIVVKSYDRVKALVGRVMGS